MTAALAAVYAGSLSPALALDPSLALVEPWRVVAWPLAHASLSHLLWDLVPFGLLGALVEPEGRARLAVLLGVTAVVPALAWTALATIPLAGASGWDSALFVVAALDLLGRPGASRPARFLGGLALVLFGAKVALESFSGQALFLRGAAPAAAPVHLLCALLGGAVWLLFRRCRATLPA